MESVTRTIYGAHLQTCKMLSRPFTVLPNSTLNQKFNVFQDELPMINEYPTIKYIAIGNKGASYELTSDGFVLTTPIPHLARDASLYNFIPFIVRAQNNDLPSDQRQNYRLRVPITVGGVNYFAYYLKVLPISNVVPSVELRNVTDGQISATNFIPDVSDLNPKAPNLSNVNLNNPNGDYLVSSAKLTFYLDKNDINEIIDACTILYNDPRYALINEIAIVSGIDRNLTYSSTLTYTEVVCAQITAFISQYHALNQNTSEVTIDLDIGSVEPLLV